MTYYFIIIYNNIRILQIVVIVVFFERKKMGRKKIKKDGETPEIDFENLKPLSVGKIAKLCNLDRTTIFRWIKRGKLTAWTTPGGHFRVSSEEFIKFIHEYKIPIDKPEKKEIRALCIDDDDGILKLYKTVLAKLWEGFTIKTTNSGFEGIIEIGRFNPDFIILDLDMEEFDGFSVIKHLKSDKKTKDTIIIVVSKFLSNQNIFRITHLGVDGYAKKPLSILDFANIVNKVCQTDTSLSPRYKRRKSTK